MAYVPPGMVKAGVYPAQHYDMLVGVTSPNADPVPTELIQRLTITGAGAVATKETVVGTLGATYTPSPGDEAMLVIGLTDYGMVYAAAVQDLWHSDIGGAPAGGDIATLDIPGGAGTPYHYTVDGAKQAKYDGTVAGTPGAGDVFGVTLVGAAAGLYQYNWAPGDTVTSIATGIKNALNSGSYDEWKIVYGAAGAAGEQYALHIGANTYTYTTLGADTGAVIQAALTAAAAADPNYTVSGFSTSQKILAKTRGAGSTVTCTSTGGGTITITHPVTGIAAQSTWTASSGVGTVSLLHAAGATTDTASGGVVHGGTGTGTFSLSLTTPGKDLDSPTVIAAGVAAAAAANGLYTVSASGPDVDLDQITPGVGVAVASSITGAGSFVATHDQVGAAATTKADMVTAIAALAAGDADYDVTTNGTTTVTATAKVAGSVALACNGRAVSCGWNPNAGGSTFTFVETVLGQQPTEVQVSDGNGHSWSHTFTVGQTNTQLASALKALIDGSFGYVATKPSGTVVEVTRTDYGNFGFVDQTVQNAGSTVVTPTTTQVLNPPDSPSDGFNTSRCRNATATLTPVLAGTVSYDIDAWYVDPAGTWIHNPLFVPTTINAGNSGVPIPLTLFGTRTFIEVKNFVGFTAAATVTFDC